MTFLLWVLITSETVSPIARSKIYRYFKYAFSMLFLFLYNKVQRSLIRSYSIKMTRTIPAIGLKSWQFTFGSRKRDPNCRLKGSFPPIISPNACVLTRRPYHTNRVGVNTLPFLKKYRSICWYVTISHYPFHCHISV
jgi:hypothetical protein